MHPSYARSCWATVYDSSQDSNDTPAASSNSGSAPLVAASFGTASSCCCKAVNYLNSRHSWEHSSWRTSLLWLFWECCSLIPSTYEAWCAWLVSRYRWSFGFGILFVVRVVHLKLVADLACGSLDLLQLELEKTRQLGKLERLTDGHRKVTRFG